MTEHLARIANRVQSPDMPRLAALDPTQSVWVSASAGSGKTTLLTERVLRLLLQSRLDNRVKLPNIVCLTYTKAAAAEMQNRVHKQLSEWAILPEAALQHRLEETFEIKTNTAILKKARRLFAEVLDRPDALRIMTMHAFCQMILNRFPHEAGLAPHFTLLQGEDEKRFHENVLARFYVAVKQNADLSDALQILGATQSMSRTKQMLQQVFHHTGKWAQHFAQFPDIARFKQHLQEKLGLHDTGSEHDYMQQQCTTYVPEDALRSVLAHLEQGTKTDKDRATEIGLWLSAPDKRVENFNDYYSAFITDKDEIRSLVTKGLQTKFPEILDVLRGEAERVLYVQEQRLTIRFYHQQIAFYKLSMHLWQMNEDMKHSAAHLTHDDVILKTRNLLAQSNVAPWILYKLDGGIDHMLIDEAQDTSPTQWEIIFQLLEEMLAGQGARSDIARTLFVVGDEKQSIYSFQGADHRHYTHIKTQLLERFRHLEKPMIDVERVLSFRSAPDVLKFVDDVFGQEDVRSGVTDKKMQHFAHRPLGGCVEVWPTIKSEKKELPEPWHAPIERDDTQHAYVQLATQIADRIAMWLQHGWQIKTKNAIRPIKPDDIIILLQRRSNVLAPIIRALKEKNIPVAGIDRMKLKEQPAVQDVMSLCRFLLLPQDDLTLAEVLRGPLIRVDEDALFELAHKRDGSLWNALQKNARMEHVCAYLKTLLNMADQVSCFTLLSHLFYTPCPGNDRSGKTAMIHRLGMDAVDPLDQLLYAARRFDGENPLSLQGFVRSVTQDESELKREQSDANGEVRIMTTHGAKGLEAPIIILPDLMRNPHKKGEPPALFWDADGFPMAATPNTKLVHYVQRVKDYHKEAQEEEHRRLLYVALTRAADVLILCSAMKNKETETPWHNHVMAAMQRLQAQESDGVIRYGDAQTLFCPATAAQHAAAQRVELPAWTSQNIANIPIKQTYLNPSLLMQKTERQLNPQTASFQRGKLLHRLLQILPDIDAQKQETQALRFLQHHGVKTAHDDVREIMAVLRNPVFAELFSNKGKAEIPIIGTVMGKHISGQIDRLLVTEHEVLVVDFKTNRPPPIRADDVDESYLVQMACYTELLKQLYAGKAIKAALLWTHTLTLMPLSQAHLARGIEILRGLTP